MIDVADAHFVPIGTAGGRLYLETDRDAPLGRVVAVDAHGAGPIEEIVPEGEDALEFVRSSATGSRPCTSTTHTTGSRCSSWTAGGRARSRCRASA